MKNLTIFKSLVLLYYSIMITGIIFLYSIGSFIDLSLALFIIMVIYSLFINTVVFNKKYFLVPTYYKFFEDYKKIYHTNYQNLYITIGEKRTTVWYQGKLYRKIVASIGNQGSKESLILELNQELGLIYSRESEVEEWQRNKLSILNDWDGSLDEKSKRNRKLDDIL